MIITAICVCVLIFLLVLGGGICLSVTGKLNSQVVGALVFGLIGTECLGICSAIVWERHRFAQKAVSVQGEVIDDGAVERQNSDGQWVKSHAPKVRFVTAQERVFEFIGPVVENGQGYAKGDQVKVLYLPDKPESARINAFDPVWLMAAGLFVIGGVFGGIALRVLLQKQSAENASGPRLVSERGRSRETFPPRT